MAVFLDTTALTALAIGVGLLVFYLKSSRGTRNGEDDAFDDRAKHDLWSGGW